MQTVLVFGKCLDFNQVSVDSERPILGQAPRSYLIADLGVLFIAAATSIASGKRTDFEGALNRVLAYFQLYWGYSYKKLLTKDFLQ